MNAIVGHLVQLPCISLKSGGGVFAEGRSATMGLPLAIDAERTPVIFLDARERPQVFSANKARDQIAKEAIKGYDAFCEALVQRDPPVADTLDVMALAYFQQVLYGINESADQGDKTQPLHIVLENLEKSHDKDDPSRVDCASDKQARDTVDFLANRLFQDRLRANIDVCGEATVPDDEAKSLRRMHATSLLQAKQFHGTNIGDIDGARHVVESLVTKMRSDRLPTRTNLRGMRLLRQAWHEYDVAVYLSNRYRFQSVVLFLLEIAASIALVIWSLYPMDSPLGIFILSLFSSLLVSLMALMNPTRRWRQLHSSACLLESELWKYRTRVADFVKSSAAQNKPEDSFCKALVAWRSDLVAGTDLQSTALEREYPDFIFKHNQYDGTLPDPLNTRNPSKIQPEPESDVQYFDDFHSPVKPEEYAQLRLMKEMGTYQSHVRSLSRWVFCLQLFLMLCGAVCALLAHLEETKLIAVVSVVAISMICWSEFMDFRRHLERDTLAIRSIKNLHSGMAHMAFSCANFESALSGVIHSQRLQVA